MPINETTFTHDIIDLPALNCPSIIVIIEGTGKCQNLSLNLENKPNKRFERGDIFYIAPNQKIRLNINLIQTSNNSQSFKTSKKHRFLAYRTFSYSVGPDHSNRLNEPLVLLKNNSSEPMLNDTKTMIINYNNNNGIILKKILNENNNAKSLNRFEKLFEVESEMDGFL